MKRLAVILLACLVLVTNTGLTLHAHYCMGNLVDINLASHDGDKKGHICPKCGMQKSSSDNGCCQDEHVVIKASDHTVFTPGNYQVQMLVADIVTKPMHFVASQMPELALNHRNLFRPHGPPLAQSPPLYLKHCVFLI